MNTTDVVCDSVYLFYLLSQYIVWPKYCQDHDDNKQ